MQKESKAKLIPKRKQGRALNVNGAFPDLREDSDQNTPCGLKVPLSIFCAKCGWITC